MLKINLNKVAVRALLIITAPFIATAMMLHIVWLALKPSTKYEELEKLCQYYKINN